MVEKEKKRVKVCRYIPAYFSGRQEREIEKRVARREGKERNKNMWLLERERQRQKILLKKRDMV